MKREHVGIAVNLSTEADICAHLKKCDQTFAPALSTRVDIADYSRKIRQRALTVEAWAGDELVGLVAAYLSPSESSCFITNVSISNERSGSGIATRLLTELFEHARSARLTRIDLEVSKVSSRARKLYSRLGFEEVGERGDLIVMKRTRDHASEADGEGSAHA